MQFTRLLCVVFLYAAWTRSADIFLVWYAAVCGTYVSFTIAPLLDKKIYQRMRTKSGWSVATFYAGHFVLHVAPLIYACLSLPRPQLWHGLSACTLHCFWYAVNDMDELYVPMKRSEWHALMLSAMTAEVLICRPL